jgi:ATP-dependent helicase HrpB
MAEPLPILEIIPELKRKLASGTTLVLQAPPGAGKSTVLPLELLKEPWLQGKKIVMLEPRRLAARAVATRMASLLGEQVGETVGYRVRFDNRVSRSTRMEVVTEGILTRMLQQDNTLEDVGLVLFDEFHERSLHADLALALCREVQQVLREDLRIVIMSATLDTGKLASLLGNAPVLDSSGRQHPVTYQYQEPESGIPLHRQMASAIRRAYTQHEGDILAFLPGIGEIQRTQELLEQDLPQAVLHPLYGDLSPARQQEALLPDSAGRRKIVLATSIAETSLTIEGIKVVVDSGYSRVPRFDLRTGLTRLETVRVTRDTADQRAGRAGRLGPGTAIRLWSEGYHHHLVPHNTPEILEADLTPAVLELSNWGVKQILDLAWLTPPPSAAVARARELLRQLGALEDDRITERGKELLRLPTHPRIAHLLLEGTVFGLKALATDIAALLEERDPLSREAGSNLTLRVEALRRWRGKEYAHADRNVLERIERVAASWRKTLGVATDNVLPPDHQVGRLLAAAYPERIARQREQNNRYRLANGRLVKLEEHDPLSHESWLAVAHMDAGSNEGRIHLAAPVDPEDILYLAHEKDVITWDREKGLLIARREQRIGDIIVKTAPIRDIPENARRQVLLDLIKEEADTLLSWTDEISQWQARLLSLKTWRPGESWPDVSQQQLVSTIDEWLGPFIGGVRKAGDFKKLDLMGILQGLIPWETAQRMEQLAPAKLKVPSGSMIGLEYSANGSAPVLAVRLQEMFGLLDTPTVNEGRTQVLLHLLSPGYKPVQVTQDLQSFWKNIYPEVRKELRIRYKRHHWPEDPWTAEAMRGAKKRGD